LALFQTTLAELVRNVAQADGAKPAILFADQPISYADLDAQIEQAANGLASRGVARGDRIALLLPNIPAMNAFVRAGATIVLVRRFDPLLVLEQMQKHRCTIFHGAPPMYVAWVNTPTLGDYDLSSMRAVYSGAAPLPNQVLNRFRTVTGIEIVRDMVSPRPRR
jgi:acyl-CoA synthetase (AMP-forming)/AMP-acid ligase II